MLEEDLRSPCTEGIAVFRALALPRLRDPEYTRMLLVTLAQATPVHEASRSHRDRRRAGIEPYGWVVNASLAASSTTHPLLVERAHLELAHLRHVETEPCRSFLGRAVAGHASRRRGGPLALTNGAALQDASESDGARSVEGRWPGAGSA